MSGVCGGLLFLHVLPSDCPHPLASTSSLVLFADVEDFNSFRPVSTCLPLRFHKWLHIQPLAQWSEYVMDFMCFFYGSFNGETVSPFECVQNPDREGI